MQVVSAAEALKPKRSKAERVAEHKDRQSQWWCTHSAADAVYVCAKSLSGIKHVADIFGNCGGLKYPKDSQAGSITAEGYWTVEIRGKKFQVHRLVYEMHYGKPPVDQIDHIDGDKLNNRVENLRVVSHRLNQRNKRASKASKTGISGVTKSAGKYPRWLADWQSNEGVRVHKSFSIGKYGDVEAQRLAIKAREEALVALGGYTKQHGTPRVTF